MTRFCGRCGAHGVAPDEGLPAGWSLDTGGDEVVFLCGACTRLNVRAIEARLPEEWWE